MFFITSSTPMLITCSSISLGGTFRLWRYVKQDIDDNGKTNKSSVTINFAGPLTDPSRFVLTSLNFLIEKGDLKLDR